MLGKGGVETDRGGLRERQGGQSGQSEDIPKALSDFMRLLGSLGGPPRWKFLESTLQSPNMHLYHAEAASGGRKALSLPGAGQLSYGFGFRKPPKAGS